MLNPRRLELWQAVTGAAGTVQRPMSPVIAVDRAAPLGYRRCGKQTLRIDLAEDLLRNAHQRRMKAGKRAFTLNPGASNPGTAPAAGVTTATLALLLRQAGFRHIWPKPLGKKAYGPPAPVLWRWMPAPRESNAAVTIVPDSPFATLAQLVV